MDVFVVTFDIDYGNRKELDMRAIMVAEDTSEAEEIIKSAYNFYSPIPNCPSIHIKSVENMFFIPDQMFVFGTCPYSINEFMKE